MSAFPVIIVTALAAYATFVAIRLGLHQRLPLILRPMSLERIPDRAARMYGDSPLFSSDTPVDWTVPALEERYPSPTEWSARRIQLTASYLGAAFARLAVNRGDRVAILKRNHLDIHLLILGITRVGAIACPMNGRFVATKVQPYVDNVGARVMVSDVATLTRILDEDGTLGGIQTVVPATPARGDAAEQRLLRLLAQRHPRVSVEFLENLLSTIRNGVAAAPRAPEDPMYLVHSSGTTGFPKAVILRNGAQSHAVRGWLAYVHLSRTRDRGLVAVPNNHQAVILTFNSALLLGLPVKWTAACAREDLDPEWLARELAYGSYTGFFAFPIVCTLLKEIDWSKHDVTGMRFWASTADAAHAEIERVFFEQGGAFRGFGLPLRGSVYLDAQGSSEVGTPSVIRYVTAYTRSFDRRVGRPGSTPFGPRVRITGRSGERVRRGEVGRLEVKGRTLFGGYWNNHALTYAAMRGGWFFTGDVARQDRDGHIIQLDREVDVIHTRTGPVYSLPIEEILHSHPMVFDACVYGAAQPDRSQAPAAAVALRPGRSISAPELLESLNAILEPKDQLTRVDILEWADFPIGITGKTLKRVFRERTEAVPLPEMNRPVLAESPALI